MPQDGQCCFGIRTRGKRLLDNQVSEQGMPAHRFGVPDGFTLPLGQGPLELHLPREYLFRVIPPRNKVRNDGNVIAFNLVEQGGEMRFLFPQPTTNLIKKPTCLDRLHGLADRLPRVRVSL